jgi:hypothetical protein
MAAHKRYEPGAHAAAAVDCGVRHNPITLAVAKGNEPLVCSIQERTRLERARRLYLLGDLDENAYAAEKREAHAVLDVTAPTSAIGVRDVSRLLSLAEAWPKASLEARRAFVETLASEIRLGERIEVVVRPELRRMVAAIAAPDVRWARTDLNCRPLGCEPSALTTEPRAREKAGVRRADPDGFEPATLGCEPSALTAEPRVRRVEVSV